MERKSVLSISNKITLYKQVLKPVWTCKAFNFGLVPMKVISESFNDSRIRYIRDDNLHYDLKIKTIIKLLENL